MSVGAQRFKPRTGKMSTRKRSNCARYAVCCIDTPVGKKMFLLHRIVLFAFRGNPPTDHTGDHIDIDVDNNHLSNLRCVASALALRSLR